MARGTYQRISSSANAMLGAAHIARRVLISDQVGKVAHYIKKVASGTVVALALATAGFPVVAATVSQQLDEYADGQRLTRPVNRLYHSQFLQFATGIRPTGPYPGGYRPRLAVLGLEASQLAFAAPVPAPRLPPPNRPKAPHIPGPPPPKK